MKRTASIVGALALVLFLSGGSAAAEDTATFTGSFVWNNEKQTGDFEAVFTATGEGIWDVVFHFIWEDEPRVFAGTAEGSLTTGELKGEVLNATKEYTFTFAGAFEGDTFSGTHAVLRDGEEKDTGTLTLER